MSKTNVAVINVANEVKDGYGQLWNEKAGEAESSTVEFLGKLYQKQGKYYLHKNYIKGNHLDYILFTGESENKGKNALCLLAEVTDFKEIEPVEVMGKTYTMECHVNKKVQVITNNVPTRNYENNVGSLQQRVLSFESKEEVQKFLEEEGAVLVTEEI